ncbi:bifunctional diaminohydroxyphosphoribosylaminopyrimidine deaminase/5-amino-6-(5-phosphoribosylamino)uracil reductase RibD [Campylobacter sp. MIT 21-1685]|uniref:bifunctional diaminohydroxyphosphoribosylaminopyrimidine deaminase/5-amino-6-(5-phosphoribosylamino)uracil reductase RibD n=1 Tax=unclassified Campylobacter TaxID=2593542 RepID=UPI00224A878D|nr:MULTISPECIES: bifunctional diaminohydroxyphosphoribosylaminopyrimidine deaminase/5-amino-6-(5-phosphoribosylamino)uracil reductase RibD [unclassified Campylobacter]MCX2682577.1 bifunctional diaminohydroxyphosphoribosylaminopyrimidine deaminase/5-amino-6-(5-phosphoribosylamino)uracil reductase RibD [Campylobacter sp. MIT 21-1684]MCX2750857.1 bifunctional diaminohydroxyphosphoribosylaminopyrimidine deaminase/5-amino-6-(5-phosphoribosylamino)uracil reductase RibD [Campylobacter sp. MIT 21-1682]M
MKELYMQLAFDEAWKYQFLTYPNPAVGCVILDTFGKILSIKAHEKAGEAHAELNAIKEAFIELTGERKLPKQANALHQFLLQNHNNIFKGASAFVTLEPCNHQGKTPPCAELFATLGFEKVFISLKDENSKASGGAEFLKHRGVEVEIGISANKGLQLIKPFLKWQKGTFKLFKLALSMNGSPFGTIISNELSRTYAHKIRSVVDILAVGGETVRKDRPLLDSRLAQGKNPNLCIFTQKTLDSFDQTIPLFRVSNRKIFTQIPQEAKFIMYEGGQNFLQNLKAEMDMFLIFQSSKCYNEMNIQAQLHFTPLYRGFLGDDNYGIYEL